MARVYKKLDAGGGSGGGGGSATKYIQSFNATSDWTLSSGYYVISIPQSSHNCGVNPLAHLFELVAAEYEEVEIDRVKNDASGNLELRVTLNARFTGKVVIL